MATPATAATTAQLATAWFLMTDGARSDTLAFRAMGPDVYRVVAAGRLVLADHVELGPERGNAG